MFYGFFFERSPESYSAISSTSNATLLVLLRWILGKHYHLSIWWLNNTHIDWTPRNIEKRIGCWGNRIIVHDLYFHLPKTWVIKPKLIYIKPNSIVLGRLDTNVHYALHAVHFDIVVFVVQRLWLRF